MMGNIYFKTNKFYTIPSFKEYHLAKTAHIKASHPQYDTQQTDKKWDLLITELTNSLEQKHMPNGMQASDFKTRLADFKATRETTPPSPTNLSLEKLVNYFEEFNFLYRTTNDFYKLTDAAKKDLLQSISEAMGVCETGLNGRLYTALQVHQKENDWIQNELVKARCVTLGLLHTAYGVGGVDHHNVHTYNTLVQLANDANLGIPQKEDVVDVYANWYIFSSLPAFFNAQYPTLFASYENDIEDCLTNHYLSELASTLGIDNVAWTHHTITMNYLKTSDIDLSTQAYFQKDDIVLKIGDIDEDNVENYVLKTKQDVTKEIKALVRKKLIADQYLVSLDQIVDDPRLRQQVLLKEDTVIEVLISLYKALKDGEPQQIHDILKQDPLMLLRYPELISKICSNPVILSTIPRFILSTIPRWLRNDSRFMDASMTALDQLLCKAIAENDAKAIEHLTEQVLYLIQSEYDYLEQLSQPVLANRLVAETLIKKNSLLFAYLDDALHNDLDLLATAVLPATFGDVRKPWIDKIASAHSCLYQMLPKDFMGSNDLFFVTGKLYRQTMTDFLKVQALAVLLSPSKISISTFLEHVNCLSPDQLLEVIRYRKEKQQQPLPFFDDHRDLEKFIQEIETQLEDIDWHENYLSIKRRACEKENFKFMDTCALKTAVTFLAKTDRWFSAFNQYQGYQTSNERLWTTLMGMAGVLIKLVVPIVTIGLTLAFFYWLYLYIAPNIILLSKNIQEIICMITLNPCLHIIGYQSKVFFKTIIDNIGSFTIFLDMISRAFSHFTNKKAYRSETLEETCENIVIRLEGINEASAQGKAELLRELLTQIKTDQEDPFKDRLGKKYPIMYHGSTHQVSFQEIASMRRERNSEFKLSNGPEVRGFFSRRTTTETLLSVSLAL